MKSSSIFTLVLITLFLLSLNFVSANVDVVATNQSSGVIRGDFYGASVGITALNNTDSRTDFINSGLTYIRQDMKIDAYYSNTTSADGVNFTQHGQNITPTIDLVKWAYNNNKRMLFISAYMPLWLADNSTGYCTNLYYCPPSNYTIWSNLVLDYINRVTEGNLTLQSIIDVEVWNEPDNTAFMGKLNDDNITKSPYYNNLYNATYTAIKNNNSNIQVGGPAVSRSTVTNMFNNFITNFSGRFDFVSFHSYPTSDYSTYWNDKINTIQSFCATQNISCSRFILSEFNTGTSDLRSNTSRINEYAMVLSQLYTSYLLKYPNNISVQIYSFRDTSDYAMINSSNENERIPYNITKSFANNHKAGENTVYNATSSDSGVKVVISKDSDQTFITLINTNTTANKTVNLNLNAVGTIGYLKDYDTNQVYNLNTPITLQSNDVVTLYEVLGSTSGNAITITNSPSGDITIADHDVQINSTINSENPLSYVQTNLSGTVTNIKDPSLILCYNFDNRSALGENDTYVYDDCGGNNGTVIGGSNVSMTSSGKYNGGVNFSGNLSYVNIPVISDINESRNFSVSGWFKTNSITTNQVIIAQSNPTNHRFQLNIGSATGGLYYGFYNTSTYIGNGRTQALTPNTWYHFVYTFNPVINGISNGTLYLNGVYNTPNANNPSPTSTAGFRVGTTTDGTLPFNGTIDEVRIWNRTLSANEVQFQYISSLNKFNSTQYSLYGGASSINNLSNTYQVYVNDTLANNVSSTLQNIYRKNNINLSSTNLFSVNPYFYGVNTHGFYLANGSGSTYNVILNRLLFENVKLKVIRIDSYIGLANSTGSFNSYNLETARGTVTYAKLIGAKVIVNFWGMPDWLANTTNAEAPCSTNNNTCMPTNMTQYTNLEVSLLNQIGCDANTCIAEIGNEPDSSDFFLAGLDESIANNSIRSKYYNQLYNDSYIAIKANMSMDIIAPATTYTTNSYIIMNNFLSNFSNQMDGVSLHRYIQSDDTEQTFQYVFDKNINPVLGNCTLYSANCAKFYIDEWNVYNSSLQEVSAYNNQYSSLFASGYSWILNKNATQFFSVAYQWQGDFTEFYNETNNLKTPPYNVTYDYARYCPSGWSVYNTSNDYNAGIVQVYCTDGTNKGIITTNIENNQQNITINGLSANELLIDVNSTNLLQANSSGSISGIVLDNYSVNSYTIPNLTLIEDIGLNKTNYLGEQIGDYSDEINISASAENDAGKTYHIASSVKGNVTLKLDVECGRINQVTLKPKDGTLYNPNYSCSGDILTIPDAIINISSTSNEVVIYYGAVETTCNNFFETGNTFIQFIIIFIIVGVCIFVIVMIQGGPNELDLESMSVMALIALVVFVLGFIIINNIGNC